jgi:Holliday junction resolvasome RuvABC endonuclease subunit
VNVAVGLDASETRLGWAIVNYETQAPVASGVEDLRQPGGGYQEHQLLRAIGTVAEACEGHEVWVVGVEDAYMGVNPTRSMTHAGVVGMSVMASRVLFGDITIWPISPNTWRSAINLKAKSRKRVDLKAAAVAWATSILGRTPATDDEADALGIATAVALLTITNEAAA